MREFEWSTLSVETTDQSRFQFLTTKSINARVRVEHIECRNDGSIVFSISNNEVNQCELELEHIECRNDRSIVFSISNNEVNQCELELEHIECINDRSIVFSISNNEVNHCESSSGAH